MGTAPFRISAPQPVTIHIGVEPVYNGLISLSLLHVSRPGDVDEWIAQTAAALTADERQRNRLVFEGLGELLIPSDDYEDFPAYLTALAAQPPAALRDRFLDRLARPAPGQGTAPSAATLLNDDQAFAEHVASLYPAEPADPALLAEVHRLVNDPATLHDLVVSHLGHFWERHLAAEWKRKLPFLQWKTRTLNQREWHAAPAADTIRSFIGRDLPAQISGQLEGIRDVRFVLSPHLGPYAARFGSETTLRVFVRGRADDLPLRQAPVKRVELIGPFEALADDTRLQILELLGQAELQAQEIIARLDLSQSSISRHLKQLKSAGFVQELRGEGANKRYRLNPGRVDWVFRSLQQLLTETPPPPAADPRSQQAFEIRRFLAPSGEVETWPAKRKDQQAILQYLAAKFEVGRSYTEREVNALLQEWDWSRDAATMRRDLYDERLLERTSDGARYWRPADKQA